MCTAQVRNSGQANRMRALSAGSLRGARSGRPCRQGAHFAAFACRSSEGLPPVLVSGHLSLSGGAGKGARNAAGICRMLLPPTPLPRLPPVAASAAACPSELPWQPAPLPHPHVREAPCLSSHGACCVPLPLSAAPPARAALDQRGMQRLTAPWLHLRHPWSTHSHCAPPASRPGVGAARSLPPQQDEQQVGAL